MLTCVVITDPETADGFRLAGVEVFVSRKSRETRRLVRMVMDGGKCGLLLVGESLMADIGEALMKRIDRGGLPVVLPVPLDMRWWQEEKGMEYLLQLIRRSIGYHMRLKK